jgi:hypothetical protein
MYAELSYFHGYHFQHIAAYHDHLRLAAIKKLLDRRRSPR